MTPSYHKLRAPTGKVKVDLERFLQIGSDTVECKGAFPITKATHSTQRGELLLHIKIHWRLPWCLKGATIPLCFPDVRIGLGWAFSKKKSVLDLDASVILVDKHLQHLDLAAFNKKRTDCGAVVHAGDNRTGEGDGDDEQIRVRLSLVTPLSLHLPYAQANPHACGVFPSALISCGLRSST